MREASRHLPVLLLACLFFSRLPLAAQSNAVKPHYEGRLRADYDYRAQGSQKDNDLYEYWYGLARDLLNGKLDVYASGRSHQDLDKPVSSSLADDQFMSLDDSDGVQEDRILQLYADGHDRKGNFRLRAGRQYIETSDYIHLDGAQAMLFEQARLGMGGYYGNPVSYYSSLSGDHAGGIWLTGRPWEGNKSRFTFAEYDDHNTGESDRNYFMDSQQELTEAARLSAAASFLNDEFRMARGDFFYFAPGGVTDFYCGASQWGSFDAKTRAYSPLYSVLGKQEPATYAYARISQQLSPHFMLSPGVSCRFADGDGQDYANSSYNDYDVALIFEPNKKFSASISADYWDVTGGDSFLGLSGELRYKYARLWEIALGSAYADYTYNTYSDISYSVNGGQTVFSQDGTVAVEDPNSYTYFLKMKWYLTRKLTLRLQGDIEDDSTASDLGYRARASIEVRL